MISIEARDDISVLRVSEPRLDASRAPMFKAEMGKHIEDGANRIVLDLSQVEFIDSSGLGALVSSLKRLGPKGNLVVAGAQGPVRRLFSLTRMDKVFNLHDTVDAAVNELNA